MARMLLCFGFSLVTAQFCVAQKKWKDQYYLELTDENFRDFKGFKANQPKRPRLQNLECC